ncbi:lipoprotein-releasing ABC transporter permease subunit LolE [Aeromonas veronii]|uniref:lipoprotein-releasing ABC transporter permease subunit LolE n=1 Tax=Aeromonas TaxID=642 RepID=UPI000718367E|nr:MULTISPECIES: lipoprotein-releasing ABC transporter permease subunit LolE [Aeromonas]KRV86568.1 outer membrane-specific lipoprotein transporter subunit LolE [Aeromonas veronii]KRW03401.1 outer membrane-specific lipoprotein transporter subunit LolE [Aeromonas veronii]KRW12472.1 outer membrane-specific lipoprotein transporter subunit LolE [Aeromonas veronii]KRW15728.1 outer membrane-specific lipoprotein transporter subunit LolE [Aeromonas veronii]KRW21116.1 outer membrane-specific lipoprotein
MFKPLPLFLGLRYSRSRRRNGFIAFISASSLIGIALGVMALILGLSAMNGFERELKDRVLSVVPQGELDAVERPLPDWPRLRDYLLAQPGVEAAAPVIRLNGLLEHGSALKGVQLRAVLPELEANLSDAGKYMTGRGLRELQPGERGVILGKTIADKLGVKVGDSVALLLPQGGDQAGIKNPRREALTVVGLLEIGGQLDGLLGFMHLADAQGITGMGSDVEGFSLRVSDVLNAQNITIAAAQQFPHHVYIRSWMNSQGYLYQDIQMVRTVMYVVMLMVVAVACFNIVSTLVMAVNEKRSEIAILKTMGASPGQIRLTFVIQGMVNGVAGALLGALLGGLLSSKLTQILSVVEKLIGHRFLNPDIYFIDFLPTELHMQDLLIVTGAAILMSLVATLYPAWRASGLVPSRELGH